MRRSAERFHCIACHARFAEHADFCDCGREDTIAELEPDEEEDESGRRRGRAEKLASISATLPPKMSTGRAAWDLVLGGGLTRPSSVLVQGPKGVGKSTSALRIADHVSQLGKGVALYGASEMPKAHVRRLGDLLGLKMTELYINDSGHLEDMVTDIEELRPILVVWDSIQRFFVNGILGEIALRDTVVGAIGAGKRVRAASMLLSQVTKADQFVGRSSIGHDVDVILELKRASGSDDADSPLGARRMKKHKPNVITVACHEKNRFAATPISATETLHDGGARPRASQGVSEHPPRTPRRKEQSG